jgi:Predicted aminopeptidases
MNLRRWISLLLIMLVFAAGTGISYLAMRPPEPPSGESQVYPSYARMLANVAAMTKAPHPSGSGELADVRAYLISQIEAMGLQVEVHRCVCSLDEIAADRVERERGSGRPDMIRTPSGLILTQEDLVRGDLREQAVFDENDNVTLYNLLVKLDSPASDRGILFMAHYDSEFGVPGAADDMVSVGALLEVMRLQAKNPDLRNDLYFLFTDGEELGGIGAKAFVRDNPELADRIDLVVNMDARGTSGGLLMFETSLFDYDQVKHWRNASSRPIAYSWLPMIYRQMSNGTDLTRFLDAGYQALNFAVIEGAEHYSTGTDDIHHLNPGTAYHYLLNAMELGEYAANASLKDKGDEQDGVYFTLLPGLLVLMNGFSAQALAGAAIAAALACLVWRLRSGKSKFLTMLYIAGVQLSVVAVSALAGMGVVSLIDAAWPPRLQDGLQYHVPVLICTLGGIGAAALVLFSLLVRRQTFGDTLAGALPLLMLATAVTAIYFNKASYLVSFPLLGLVIAAFLEKHYIARIITAVVVGVGTILLHFPACWILFIALGLEVMPVITGLATIPITLVAVLFKPHFSPARPGS